MAPTVKARKNQMGLTAICWTAVVAGFTFGNSQDKEKNALSTLLTVHRITVDSMHVS